MARKEADLKNIQITQYLKCEYWHWTDDEKKSIGNVPAMLAVICDRLQNGGCVVAEMYGILHDKDVNLLWNSNTLQNEIVAKENHLHCVIRFDKGATLAVLAGLIGVEPQYLEKAKSGKFGYDNMLSYLIHIKYTDKHQYDPAEVFTLVGKPYIDIYNSRHTDWIKGRAKVKAAAAKVDIDYLEELILTGQVTKEQVSLTDEYYVIYARNARRCDDAFRVYGERRAYKTMQAMKDKDFRLSVLFFTGKAGHGKTHAAKMVCDRLINDSTKLGDEPWRVCLTAATNPLDEYNGEEILFMDDVRGVSLGYSDWLKLLDPENVTPGSARYKNKTPACRCVIITSTKDVIEFFYYCKNIGGSDRSEALDQFIRRIMACVTVYNTDGDRTAKVTVPVKTWPYLAQAPDGTKVDLSYAIPALDGYFNVPVEEISELLSDMVINQNNLKAKNGATYLDMLLSSHERVYNDERLFAETTPLE